MRIDHAISLSPEVAELSERVVVLTPLLPHLHARLEPNLLSKEIPESLPRTYADLFDGAALSTDHNPLLREHAPRYALRQKVLAEVCAEIVYRLRLRRDDDLGLDRQKSLPLLERRHLGYAPRSRRDLVRGLCPMQYRVKATFERHYVSGASRRPTCTSQE